MRKLVSVIHGLNRPCCTREAREQNWMRSFEAFLVAGDYEFVHRFIWPGTLRSALSRNWGRAYLSSLRNFMQRSGGESRCQLRVVSKSYGSLLFERAVWENRISCLPETWLRIATPDRREEISLPASVRIYDVFSDSDWLYRFGMRFSSLFFKNQEIGIRNCSQRIPVSGLSHRDFNEQRSLGEEFGNKTTYELYSALLS